MLPVPSWSAWLIAIMFHRSHCWSGIGLIRGGVFIVISVIGSEGT